MEQEILCAGYELSVAKLLNICLAITPRYHIVINRYVKRKY